MSTASELRLHAPHQHNGNGSGPHNINTQTKPLNRVRAVRLQQGVTRRTAARHFGVEPRKLDALEDPSFDLPISVIYRWQQMLEVPIEELLVESGASLSRPIMERAQMLKLMKTAVTIRNRAGSNAVQYLAEMLVEQLTAIMPDMAEVSPWSSQSDSPLSLDCDFERNRSQAEREFLKNTLNSHTER